MSDTNLQRELDALRAAAEAVREALLDDVNDLAAKLTTEKTRALILEARVESLTKTAEGAHTDREIFENKLEVATIGAAAHVYRDDPDCVVCGAYGPTDDDVPCLTRAGLVVVVEGLRGQLGPEVAAADLDEILRRGVHPHFHADTRASALLELRTAASAHRRLGQAETARAFVVLDDAHERLSRLEAELDAVKDENKVATDEAKAALADLEDSADDVKRLRAVVVAVAAALDNGSVVSADASIEFMEDVPAEVESVVMSLRGTVLELEENVAVTEGRAIAKIAELEDAARREAALSTDFAGKLQEAEHQIEQLKREAAEVNAKLVPIVLAWRDVIAPELRASGDPATLVSRDHPLVAAALAVSL